MDMGGHCVDLLEMFFGPAKAVSCMTGNLVHDYQSEDTAVVIVEFESGAKGSIDTLFCVPDASSKNRLELYGSKGSILADGTIGQGEIGLEGFRAFVNDARVAEVPMILETPKGDDDDGKDWDAINRDVVRGLVAGS